MLTMAVATPPLAITTFSESIYLDPHISLAGKQRRWVLVGLSRADAALDTPERRIYYIIQSNAIRSRADIGY